MTTESPPRNIAHYLNPAYWDGHTLGMGETLPLQTYFPGINTGQEIRHASAAIRSIPVDSPTTPLRSFHHGDQFVPSDFAPGTVALFRMETLFGVPVEPTYAITELESLPRPTRPTSIQPHTFTEHRQFAQARLTDEDKRTYRSTVRWGVIPRTGQDDFILSLWSQFVNKRGSKLHTTPIFTRTPAPITIGRTIHLSGETPDHGERLWRVNALHILAIGLAERQGAGTMTRQWNRLLGRTALGSPPRIQPA